MGLVSHGVNPGSEALASLTIDFTKLSKFEDLEDLEDRSSWRKAAKSGKI
jgi:hypothetical protein